MGAAAVPWKHLRRRMRRSLYYGRDLRMETLSQPLSDATAAYFHQHCPFDYLDPQWAAHLNREACIRPSALIVALVYLDRLRAADKKAWEAADPSELYLAALVLASKWLHDDGEKDFVYNDEWAASARLPTADLNRLELDALSRLDWRLSVSRDEFEDSLSALERRTAALEADKRAFTSLSYAEIGTLLQTRPLLQAILAPFLAALGLAGLFYTSAVLAATALIPSLLSVSLSTTSSTRATTSLHLGTSTCDLGSNASCTTDKEDLRQPPADLDDLLDNDDIQETHNETTPFPTMPIYPCRVDAQAMLQTHFPPEDKQQPFIQEEGGGGNWLGWLGGGCGGWNGSLDLGPSAPLFGFQPWLSVH